MKATYFSFQKISLLHKVYALFWRMRFGKRHIGSLQWNVRCYCHMVTVKRLQALHYSRVDIFIELILVYLQIHMRVTGEAFLAETS